MGAREKAPGSSPGFVMGSFCEEFAKAPYQLGAVNGRLVGLPFATCTRTNKWIA